MYTEAACLSFVVAVFVAYFNFPTFHTSVENTTDIKLFTSDSLRQYNGVEKPHLYLSILGKVFDVSKGVIHYGPGASYNFFVGKDASRSFITGEFGPNDASDQVSDLSPSDLKSLNRWVQFYHKEYTRVGKLIGRYYQQDGTLTRYGKEVKTLIKAAEQDEKAKDAEKLQYPPCNVEWDAEKGSRVWCTSKSGGVQRDWVGVPRKMFQAGGYRCACVKPKDTEKANFQEYESCDVESQTCFVKED